MRIFWPIRILVTLTVLFFIVPGVRGQAKRDEGVRLRNLARIEGIRSNQLLGYGLVSGLSGTGDSRSQLAAESVINLLERLGQKSSLKLNSRNVAAVLVTAEISPFARRGDRLDAVVSSIGDARSLEGGVLIRTPLQAGNQEQYAVAQGVIVSGGGDEKRSGLSSTGKTVGLILDGVLVEKDLAAQFVQDRKIRVSLKKFDFSVFASMVAAIKKKFTNLKYELGGGQVEIEIPSENEPHQFIADLENIRIEVQSPARVVINERTGTVVMGGDIKVEPVMISRGGKAAKQNMSTAGVSTGIADELIIKYGPAGDGEKESAARATSREFSGNSVAEIVEQLNSSGASVKDIIAILQALQDAGALHAEIVVI